MSEKKFPHYSSIGCYTIIYLTTKNGALCGTCAEEAWKEDGEEINPHHYFEGPPITCEGCGREMESSYGER